MVMETPYQNTPYKNNLRKRTKICVRIVKFQLIFPAPYKNILGLKKFRPDFCRVNFLRINNE